MDTTKPQRTPDNTAAPSSSYIPDAEEIEEAEMIRRNTAMPVKEPVSFSQQLRDTATDIKDAGKEAQYYARHPQKYLQNYGRIQDQFARASGHGTQDKNLCSLIFL